jgi:MFS family permease
MTNQTASRASVDTAPPTRVGIAGWWALFVLTFLSIIGIFAHYMMSMLVGDMKSDLGLSDFQMGIAMGPAFGLVYAIAGVALGWMADRYSRRWVLFGGIALFGMAHALTGFVTSFVALVGLRMVVGFGAAAIGPAAVSIVADKFSRSRLTSAIAILSTANKLGLAVTFAVGGISLIWARSMAAYLHLMGFAPWRLVFIMTGIPAIVLGLLVFTFGDLRRAPSQSLAGSQPLQNILNFYMSQRKLLNLMLLGFTLVGICTQGLIAWVPAFMARQLSLPATYYGPILGLFSTLAAAAMVVKGVIMDRLYIKGMKDVSVRFYTWLLIGALPFMAAAFLTKSFVVFVVCYFVVAVVAVPFGAYILAAAMVVTPPHLRGQMAAVVGVPVFAVGGLGPMLMGWITDHVFRNEAAIGKSIAIVLCVLIPIAIVCLRKSLAPLRVSAADAEQLLTDCQS